MSELTIDGLVAPMWTPGDDEYPERLQCSVLWSPHVLINGAELHPLALATFVPMVSFTARLAVRSLRAARERAYEYEMREVAEAIVDTVGAFADLNRDTLATLTRSALGRRGFPIPTDP